MTSRFYRAANNNLSEAIGTYTSGRTQQYYVKGQMNRRDIPSNLKTFRLDQNTARQVRNPDEGSKFMPEDALLTAYKDLSNKIDEKYNILDTKIDKLADSIVGDKGVLVQLAHIDEREKNKWKNKQTWIPVACALIAAAASVACAIITIVMK